MPATISQLAYNQGLVIDARQKIKLVEFGLCLNPEVDKLIEEAYGKLQQACLLITEEISTTSNNI
jgi:hypothetical protein